ncbi:MAG: LiaI-LiaF-like domain-containing protein [Sphingomonadaceae bacterium]
MRTPRAQRAPNPAAQVMVGVLVIGLGLLFLLDNLGFLDFDFTLHFLPLLVTVFGILKIVQARSTQGVVVGALMVVGGVLLTMRSLGFLLISWRTLWPLILIAVGVSVVYRSVIAQRQAVRPLDFHAKVADDSIINATVVMGGYTRRLVTPDFRGGEITTIMAGCELDLRQSSINGDAVLNVFALFGGIQIKVPPDWTVVLRGTPILGGFEEKTVLPPDGSKRLIVQGYAIMGGVEVRN